MNQKHRQFSRTHYKYQLHHILSKISSTLLIEVVKIYVEYISQPSWSDKKISLQIAVYN